MNQIKLQHYVEVYGEGFSWTDHIRWDEGIDLTNYGASLVLYQDGFMQAKPSINDAWCRKFLKEKLMLIQTSMKLIRTNLLT